MEIAIIWIAFSFLWNSGVSVFLKILYCTLQKSYIFHGVHLPRNVKYKTLYRFLSNERDREISSKSSKDTCLINTCTRTISNTLFLKFNFIFLETKQSRGQIRIQHSRIKMGNQINHTEKNKNPKWCFDLW